MHRDAVRAALVSHGAAGPWVQTVLGATSLEFGWLATAQDVGSLLAGAALARAPRFRSEVAVPAALAAVGVGLFALAHTPGPPAALAISAVISLPAVAADAGTQALLQLAAPETHRGRVLGAFASVGYLSVLIGQGVGGLAGDRLRPTDAFAAASVLSLGAASLLLWLPRRRPGAGQAPPIWLTEAGSPVGREDDQQCRTSGWSGRSPMVTGSLPGADRPASVG